jgi:long-chain acyl-CoA synthetase
LCHSGPLRFALSVLLAGGSVALPGWFDADRISSALHRLRPTTAFLVPSHLQRVFARADPPPSPYRLLAHAGEACAPALKRQIHAWAGVDRVWEFYGSTEGQFTACSGPQWQERPGTVGRARAGRRLRVEDGVIWCSAPSFARFRYWGDEEKTGRAWRSDAFTVGDLGRLDAQGFLYIDGRREDLIISGGVNVYPAEVEQVLGACPGVAEVAVFGRPDERWGQSVCVAYLGTAAPEEVRQYAAAHLAGFKRPKVVEHRREFPRTASGKVKRLELR